jgi:hypothetical protein
MKYKAKPKYGNKKIEAYGIKFDSAREKYMYDELTYSDIPFVFQKKYILMEGFRNAKGKKIRDMYMLIDFIIQSGDTLYVIDVKGMFLPEAKLKYKLLEKNLHDNGVKYELLFPKNKMMINDIVTELKRRQNGETILLQV